MTTPLRNAVFTINNPTAEDDSRIEQFLPFCDYLTYGREHFDAQSITTTHPPDGKIYPESYTTTESSTPHYQGYFELHNQKRFGAIRKILNRAHIEQRKGTAAQAIAYCHKEDDNPFVHGQPAAPGHRSDLDSLASRILDGANTSTLAQEMPTMVIRFSKGIEALQQAAVQPCYLQPFRFIY